MEEKLCRRILKLFRGIFSDIGHVQGGASSQKHVGVHDTNETKILMGVKHLKNLECNRVWRKQCNSGS